ncbi:PVC-type heme-binding CxxCH protein [Rubripirellula amarantea]|nr:PVC-type heme-binding CxxCH protein [Rubripirellula amarantea]
MNVFTNFTKSSRISMTKCFAMFCVIAMFSALALCSTTIAVEPPSVLDHDWQIELIASEPGLVTPTGCCFDDQGRLLVIECHTHFPPDDYSGPKTDRIYRFDDSDGDGVLDRQSLFYEGGTATMNMVHLGDGAFAVATRSEVYRLADSDDDGTAETKSVLLKHETSASYPHNGLAGLTLGPDGWLYVGQGENFGEPYQLIGTDGSQQRGGGEGGNVFRCRPDGSQVSRVATGFWNPFGLCFDAAKRLWAVGNDPDSMPPNRLMHVVDTADFGFQFRFGRAGTHPLLCWNGELPGTLPMVAGTGEAVCAVIVNNDHLLATSWGDNRIERYDLQPRGASWTSQTQVIVQGNANFRPVGMATAPDGSIYVTDWVDRSYPVHGKGRLWRLTQKNSGPQERYPSSDLTPQEIEAQTLARSSGASSRQRLASLQDADPFIRQAAIAGLVHDNQVQAIDVLRLSSADQIVGVLTAMRWQELTSPDSVAEVDRDLVLAWALKHPAESVQLTALRWSAERECKTLLPAIEALLRKDDLSPRTFAAVIAAIAYIETGSASGRDRDPATEKLLVGFASDPMRSSKLRSLAIRRLPPNIESLDSAKLNSWLDSNEDRDFASEVVRFLSARGDQPAMAALAEIALNQSREEQTRADALSALSVDRQAFELVAKQLANSSSEVLKTELDRLDASSSRSDESIPSSEDLSAWTTLVGDQGNADAGRRVFYRTQCVSCHVHSGRGSRTGPDLTTLGGTMTRQRIIESILLPSKEVGPLYVPWKVLTIDGTVHVGLKMNESGVGGRIKYQAADGKTFEIALEDIETQQPVDQSIMPTGLEKTMSVTEFRDLIAFLARPI